MDTKFKTVILQIKEVITDWIDNKKTGMLKFELHLSQGGISKIFIESRSEMK
jgi:hypothetical protein